MYGKVPPRFRGAAQKLFAVFFFAFSLLPLAAQVDIEFHGAVESLHALPFSKDLGLTDSRAAFTGEVSAYSGDAQAFVSLSAEYNGVSPERTGVLTITGMTAALLADYTLTPLLTFSLKPLGNPPAGLRTTIPTTSSRV
jgi:hypothetical protein